MKKLLFVILSAVSFSVFAHGFRYEEHRHYGGYHNNDWVAPLVIGGAIGYALLPSAPVYAAPQPMYSTNTVFINGVMYLEEMRYFPECGCYRKVLIQQ